MKEPDIPDAMRRYCVKCREPIPAHRVLRASEFCSDACRKLDRKARREYKASKYCRLCGRKARRKPVDAQTGNIAPGLCAPGAQSDFEATVEAATV